MAIIPGQSLTAEPKNAPYENSPEMVEPEKAIMWHLDRLVEPDKTEALLDALELGIDVVTLTEGLLRGAVLEGRHTVDISLVIAPVIHEFITSTANQVGIDFEEGFPDESGEKKKVKYAINKRKAMETLQKLRKEGKLRPAEPDLVEEEIDVAPIDDTLVAEGNLPKGGGLMSRPTDKGIM
tara:strand:+ start:124 stop:666 length:543 start_codon:yes stop_codon:yes gene_type:complete